jgi:hypothetical protein
MFQANDKFINFEYRLYVSASNQALSFLIYMESSHFSVDKFGEVL